MTSRDGPGVQDPAGIARAAAVWLGSFVSRVEDRFKHDHAQHFEEMYAALNPPEDAPVRARVAPVPTADVIAEYHWYMAGLVREDVDYFVACGARVVVAWDSRERDSRWDALIANRLAVDDAYAKIVMTEALEGLLGGYVDPQMVIPPRDIPAAAIPASSSKRRPKGVIGNMWAFDNILRRLFQEEVGAQHRAQDRIRTVGQYRATADNLIAVSLRAWQADARQRGASWSATVVSGDRDFVQLGPRPADSASGASGRLVMRELSGNHIGWVVRGDGGPNSGSVWGDTWPQGGIEGVSVDGDSTLRYAAMVPGKAFSPTFTPATVAMRSLVQAIRVLRQAQGIEGGIGPIIGPWDDPAAWYAMLCNAGPAEVSRAAHNIVSHNIDPTRRGSGFDAAAQRALEAEAERALFGPVGGGGDGGRGGGDDGRGGGGRGNGYASGGRGRGSGRGCSGGSGGW
ncbi:hypothetical protein FOA52_015229 [Chlamydomonas sp. UWO 241]|nr:hypothetical protein FOA52_015229 [Chlamydomonas sp. UWO 241]